MLIAERSRLSADLDIQPRRRLALLVLATFHARRGVVRPNAPGSQSEGQ